MKGESFLEKYFADLSKHFIAVATAILVGFLLAHFLKQAKLTIEVVILAAVFYVFLLFVALLFSFLSDKFSHKKETGE